MFVCSLTVLLLAAGSEAQSGDRDSDTALRLSCFSHISFTDCSLTCQLLGDGTNEDDEDDKGDGIEMMVVCQRWWVKNKETNKCLKVEGPSITSKDLQALPDTDVTVHLKTGGQVSTTVKLQKIVKPTSPRVWNLTLDSESNQVVIYIAILQEDYLTLEKLFFQMHIWTDGFALIQNISSQNVIQISTQHLHQRSPYHVKVRAIPQGYLQGTWSEWSETSSLTLPEDEEPTRMDKWQAPVYSVCFIALGVVMSILAVLWKNRIFTYMWPNIPHPKQTLVQICRPNKGFLLNLNPEVFSSLKVYPLEKTDEAGSSQSSDCTSTTSVSTEELEVSALLRRSCSDGEDSLQTPPVSSFLHQEEAPSTSQSEQSMVENRVECGINQQEEAYVTMSSFSQIK
nr:interleukin-7 receptor subunit alpha [Nothobranchius furzeri]